MQLTGRLELESLDDGGEALIVALDGDSPGDAGIWCRLISNLGDVQYDFLSKGGQTVVGVDAHPVLKSWIGKRVQITVSELP